MVETAARLICTGGKPAWAPSRRALIGIGPRSIVRQWQEQEHVHARAAMASAPPEHQNPIGASAQQFSSLLLLLMLVLLLLLQSSPCFFMLSSLLLQLVAAAGGAQVVFDYTAYNEQGRRIDTTYSKSAPARTRLGIQGLIPGSHRLLPVRTTPGTSPAGTAPPAAHNFPVAHRPASYIIATTSRKELSCSVSAFAARNALARPPGVAPNRSFAVLCFLRFGRVCVASEETSRL